MMLADTIPPLNAIPPLRGWAARGSRRDALGLSPRERQVVDCLVNGMRTDEIARTLGIKISSALTYLKRAYKITGTHHRCELVAFVTGRL
jgi:DNA-binding CsgD family transcriptional regulator